MRHRRGRVVGALAALSVLVACGSQSTGPRPVSTADAYSAAIRWYVASVPAPTPTVTTPAGPVVVYVAPADGNPIDAGAQADVVENLSDMNDKVKVIFVDVRDDAIDLEAQLQPVKDGAALLLVGKVAESPPPVEVAIEVYHNADDDNSFQMRIVRIGSDGYTVTAVTQLEPN